MKKILKKLLTKNTVYLDLEADTKDGIIAEMVNRLCAAGKIRDYEAVLQAIQFRENKMSTGMENGIAIPHGKTDRVDELVAAIGRKIEGVDFDSMDQQPSRIFIMTVSPASHSGPHLQFLAEVSKLLKDEEPRRRILEAKKAEDVIRVFV
ncbi:MAG: PTS sugar transporter subunit IIA [Candidatus Aminicenantes bacterium]|nr:PTS sugar transporter subunit IIA [Candidatus Aminicenantes bacterium]